MELALIPLAAEFGVDIELVDIDADPELEALYDEWVPVLLYEGSELCHHVLETGKVRDYLSTNLGFSKPA